MIIGLTGTKASGKGAVAEILKTKGFVYSSTSDRVREEAAARGLVNYTIKDLQDIGNDLREKYGNEILAKKTLEKLQKEKNCVIDGIRNIGEVKELRKNLEFKLIGVDADLNLRHLRLVKRERESDPKDYEKFLEMDRRDRGLNEEQSRQQVDKCLKLADYLIINNGTPEELIKKVEEILFEIENPKKLSWDKYFMKQAAVVAEKSTCLRHHVGAVVVKDKRVITTDYNGAVRGVKNCLELDCLRNELKIPSGTRHEICRAVHAEQNAIIQGAYHGVSVKDGTMYCTHTPCMICAKIIVNAGIKEIVSYQDYPDENSKKLFEEVGINLRKVERPKAIITFKD